MAHWNIKFYATIRGDKPVEAFIANQGVPTYSKIVRMLKLLEHRGPDLGMPYT